MVSTMLQRIKVSKHYYEEKSSYERKETIRIISNGHLNYYSTNCQSFFWEVLIEEGHYIYASLGSMQIIATDANIIAILLEVIRNVADSLVS